MPPSERALATIHGQGQAIAGLGEMSVQAVVDRKRKIVEVMEAVMKDGEHYGQIPGCGPKPTLLKAGAEVLAMTFGLAPAFDIERTDLPNGHREYQVVCTLTHIATGAVVAQGVGCGSTMESKHRWRGGARVCPECGKTTIIKGKAEYGGGWLCFAKKGGCGAKWKEGDAAIEDQSIDRVENPDPADQYNTVLKMAKKRAQVDCTLTACGASDLLAQDLEDLPPGSETVQRPADLVARFDACTTSEAFTALDAEMRAAWDSIPKGDPRHAVTDAYERARVRVRTKREAPAAAPARPRDKSGKSGAVVISPEEQAEIDRIEREERR